MFVLFLAVISLGVFSAKPKSISAPLTFNKPKVNIDTKIFDSVQFKSLQPFTQMQTQYSYEATTKAGKTKTGFVTAGSIDEAKAILTNMGLSPTQLKETEIGREDPFSPYYQATVDTSITTVNNVVTQNTPTTGTTTTKTSTSTKTTNK